MKIRVLNTKDRGVVKAARAVTRMVGSTGRTDSLVNVVLVSDRHIHEMNRRYLKRDRPTDVLSFPLNLHDPDGHEFLLGEVYVSRDRARLQAKEYGVTYHDEILRLILHGILHLLGLNHQQMAAWHRARAGLRRPGGLFR